MAAKLVVPANQRRCRETPAGSVPWGQRTSRDIHSPASSPPALPECRDVIALAKKAAEKKFLQMSLEGTHQQAAAAAPQQSKPSSRSAGLVNNADTASTGPNRVSGTAGDATTAAAQCLPEEALQHTMPGQNQVRPGQACLNQQTSPQPEMQLQLQRQHDAQPLLPTSKGQHGAQKPEK